MSLTVVSRRAARLLTAALALTAAAACNDSTGPGEDHADDVSAIRLVVTPAGGAAATYTIAENGTVTPSPLRVPVGQSTVVATFLAADGDVIPAAELTDFRLEFPSATGLAFARTGPFAGTLAATAAAGTSVPVALCLFHVNENHCDLGPWPNFAVTIGE